MYIVGKLEEESQLLTHIRTLGFSLRERRLMKKLGMRLMCSMVLSLFLVSVLGIAEVSASSTVSESTMELIKSAGGKDEYPDADAIILLWTSSSEYQADGTCVAHSYQLAKILTEAGLDRYSEDHMPYYKAYDTIRLITARVIKQDGRVVDVPEDYMKDISAASGEYMNIYDPDARDRVVTFKDLEVGDCIELHYIDSLYQAPMQDELDGISIFQYVDPILKKVETVNAPASMPLRYEVRNGDVSFEKKELGDRIEYRWWVENAPKVVTEPAMPSFIEIVPTLIYTTIDSWEDVSRWWNGIVESKYDMSDELKAEVASLTEGLETRDEKADAILRFVAQEVRYMGLGTGKKKGLEPKPVNETYETKYGVCRDVAALMVAMLREAGVESEIVLTSMGSKVFDNLPRIGFNHAIVALRNEDGSVTYADPTIENSVHWLPAIEAEQDVLICDKVGSTLDKTPYSSPEANMGHIKAESQLSESGVFSSDVSITTDGFYDFALRTTLKRIPPAQLNMVFGYLVQQVYPGARLTGVTTTDAEDLTQPVEINFSYQIPDYPLEANQFTLFKSPLALGVFDLISASVFGSASLPEREFPWRLGFTFGATEEETITLPPGYKLKAVPDAVDKSYGPIEYRMTYSSSLPEDLEQGGTRTTYRKEMLIKSKQMSPDEYKLLKEVLQASAKTARGEIIMVKDEG